MNHWWRFGALFGLVSLSLLTRITPVEAFGRCRSRCQCQPTFSPCSYTQPQWVGQVFGSYSNVTYQCMYCDGSTWQVATAGQPCTMRPSSDAGSRCGSGQPPLQSKVRTSTIRTIHGRSFRPDPFINLNVWYSSEDGKDYDGTNLWCCPDGALIQYSPTGVVSASGEFYYDITVYVGTEPSPKPKKTPPPTRTIHARSIPTLNGALKDPFLNLNVWYSSEDGKDNNGTNLWCCPDEALVDDPVLVGFSPDGASYYDITVYTNGKPSR
jgi:hypothetical protein